MEVQPVRPAIKLALWTLALIPVGTCLLVHYGRPSVAVAIPHPVRPALAFHQYQVDLGAIGPVGEVRGVFAFANHGKDSVDIIDVVPSCGCLKPRIDKKHIRPGEESAVVLRIQPAGETAGPKEYFADVIYSDPTPRQQRLTFKVEIPSKQMVINPRALLFYQLGTEPTEKTLTVSDPRGKPFRILGVSYESSLINTSLGEPTVTDEVPQQTVKVVVAGECPPGRQQVLLKVLTDDPDYPELRVPVMIVGPSAPAAAAEAGATEQ